MFWKVEGDTGLYIFFKTVCDVYGLIPEDNYTIPPEAEGIELAAENTSAAPPLILKREPSDSGSQEKESSGLSKGFSEHSLSTAGTTKRHRHSPSIGATAVSTVVEEAEEEEDNSGKELPRPISQIFESTPEEAEAPKAPEEAEAEAEAEAEQPAVPAESAKKDEPAEEATAAESQTPDETEEASTAGEDKADTEAEANAEVEAKTEAIAEAKPEDSTTEEPAVKEESAPSGFLELTPEEHPTTAADDEKPTDLPEKPENEENEKKPEKEENEKADVEKDETAAEPADKADKAEEADEKKTDA